MRRPPPALVLSCIAVFLSAAGGAVAAGQIGGKQIKDGSITGKDIRNDSLTGTDIKGNVRGPEGPRGPQGPQGPAGGAAGPAVGVAVSYRLKEATIPPDGFQPRLRDLPRWPGAHGWPYRAQEDLIVLDDGFGDSTSGNPDSWMAFVENPTESSLAITVFVACVTPSSVSPF